VFIFLLSRSRGVPEDAQGREKYCSKAAAAYKAALDKSTNDIKFCQQEIRNALMTSDELQQLTTTTTSTTTTPTRVCILTSSLYSLYYCSLFL
jgi:hypothetical protein